MVNAIQFLSAQVWIERLGWTLLHFLWQGALITVIYAVARTWLVSETNARARYTLALAAMLAMLAAPVTTFIASERPAHASVNIVAGSQSFPLASTSVEAPFRSLPTSAAPVWPSQLIPSIAIFWFAGAVVLWLRLLGGWMLASRMKSSLTRHAPCEWQQTLESLRHLIQVSLPVRLAVSPMVQVPTVIGWLRPVVLLPVGALMGLPPECLEALLAHELAHVRRFDNLVNIIQRVVEAMLFYHPAVWWISGHIREEREICCDDIAISVVGDRIAYARALANLEQQRQSHFVPALAANGGSLPSRIARLLGHSRSAAADLSGSGPIAGLILALLAACGLWAQAADSRPTFEVDSVKPNHSGTGVDRVNFGNGTLILENVSLQRIIGMAHGVPEGRNYLFSGPDWLDSEDFDISAKFPTGTPKPQVLQMLQRELEERFQLRLHKEMKDFNAYALVVGKDGPKLKPSATQGAYRFSMQNGHAVGSSITMGIFADRLARPDFQLGRQVVDQTGLTGSYDVTFDWKPDADGLSASLFTAIQEQLGLRLEPKKIPLEVLIVDHVNKTPTGN